jgi:hypothetical protein
MKDLYIRQRNNFPSSFQVGISPDIVNIDSVRYQLRDYNNEPGPQGIINVDANLKQENLQYVQQIKPIMQEILDLYNKLFNATMSLDNLMSIYREGFTSNMEGSTNTPLPNLFGSSLKESFSNNSLPLANDSKTLVERYKETEAQIKILSENRNMDNIIEDRGIVATQQNYLYILVLMISLGTIGLFYKYTKR